MSQPGRPPPYPAAEFPAPAHRAPPRRAGAFAGRRFAGTPGDASSPRRRPAGRSPRPHPASRPKPNGHLHIGHAKSICLNFGLARDYGGVCHLRFDDTNPEKEEQRVRRLHPRRGEVAGLRLGRRTATSHLYYASNYFDFMYRAAEHLIEAGHAYVDEQTPRKCAPTAATSPRPARTAPSAPARRPRTWPAFARCATASIADGADGAARQDRHGHAQHQPARPGHLPHPPRHPPQHGRHLVHLPDVHLRAPDRGRAGAASPTRICTLEFEDQRPFYDWLLEHLAELGLLAQPAAAASTSSPAST